MRSRGWLVVVAFGVLILVRSVLNYQVERRVPAPPVPDDLPVVYEGLRPEFQAWALGQMSRLSALEDGHGSVPSVSGERWTEEQDPDLLSIDEALVLTCLHGMAITLQVQLSGKNPEGSPPGMNYWDAYLRNKESCTEKVVRNPKPRSERRMTKAEYLADYYQSLHD